MENTRKELLRSIKENLRGLTYKPSEDDIDTEKDDTTDQDGKPKDPNKTGAKPKLPPTRPIHNKNDPKGKDKQPSYEELQQYIVELKNTLQRLGNLRTKDDQKNTREDHGRTEQMEPANRRSGKYKSQDTDSDSSEPDRGRLSGKRQGRSSKNDKGPRSYSDESDREIDDRQRDRNRNRRLANDRRSNEGRSPSNDRTSGSDRYRGRNSRDFRQVRRIEHWKLSFSGDNRTVSVENFLYKLKKIAEREQVSERNLLRDIHLILEGQASDWFFTYVDEFEDWDDFEERIRFRFGNPNQDQGIRQRIHERKQHRGESFNAFVSEIERLNKMLSKPLSRRRKFEVVWDNMRPHYRSKISIVRVRDLDHLISLNHRIDAADSSFQQQLDSKNTESRNQRNIYKIECASSEYESEEPEAVDAIEARPNRRDQRPSPRNQPAMSRTAPANQQQTTQASLNVCWNCRKAGHNWRDCKEPRAIFCYGCGELGRTIRSCQRCTGSSRRRSDQNQGNQ
ncbi:hepatoma-derived growth factor-related protein 2-like [Ochlerotatus camptorhynchus]|uniref:hepatoma-derived growth factor-related protein 2-like n=1 Tax=Ochlerotatus camptorhynchus TaxID=644619 RepID=UPI0031DCF453